MNCQTCFPYSFTHFYKIIFSNNNNKQGKLDKVPEHTFNEWENISTPR